MYKTLFIILLCLAGIANGELEEVDLGEYKVSFDLGINKSEYEIEVVDPIYSETLGGESETMYKIEISEKKNTDFELGIARITLTKYDEPLLIVSGDVLERILHKNFERQDVKVYGITTDQRSIDGKEGAISMTRLGWFYDPIIGEIPITEYSAMYQVSNLTVAQIYSTYGWDNGTSNLLKSLKVEENR